MTPKWVKIWIADLAMLNDRFRDENGTIDFAALGREEYLFRMALVTGDLKKSQRARDAFDKARKACEVSQENGSRGGRPSGPMPADKQLVYDFAEAEGLDTADAYECWEATMERGGKTADGKKVTSWKAYVRTWCSTRKENRRFA